MSEQKTLKISNGEDSVIVNESDYENGFPLNPELKKLVAELEEAPVKKVAKKTTKKAK